MFNLPKKFQEESGQTLVLIILIVMIALTVGIAVSSQAIINSRQARTEEQSAQAYAAAEAGVETALLSLKNCTAVDCSDTGSDSLSNGATYEYTISPSSLLSNDTVYEARIEKDDVVQIDLTKNGLGTDLDDVNVEIYFWCQNHPSGNPDPDYSGDPNLLAALEYTFLVEDSGDYRIEKKEVFDENTIRRSSNRFDDPRAGITISDSSGNRNYSFLAEDVSTYSFNTGSFDQRLLRIRAWYHDTWVAVRLTASSTNPGGNTTFSNQGYEIRSVGRIDNVERRIVVTRTNPYLPAIFDYVIFSGGDLTK